MKNELLSRAKAAVGDRGKVGIQALFDAEVSMARIRAAVLEMEASQDPLVYFKQLVGHTINRTVDVNRRARARGRAGHKEISGMILNGASFREIEARLVE